MGSRSAAGPSKRRAKGPLSLGTRLGDAVIDLESLGSLLTQISTYQTAIDLLHLKVRELTQRTLVSVEVAQGAINDGDF